MKRILALVAAGAALAADRPTKPKIFIAGVEPESVSAEGTLGEAKGAFALTRVTPSYDIESMRNFASRCPEVTVTTNREQADAIVRVERDEPNPTTPFVKANRVAVFSLQGDLVYATRARLLGNAVKDACAAIVTHARMDEKENQKSKSKNQK